MKAKPFRFKENRIPLDLNGHQVYIPVKVLRDAILESTKTQIPACQKILAAGDTKENVEQCAVSFADSTKTAVRIGSGTVIMPDGSYLVISGGETLTVPSADKAYVYIAHDVLEQNVPVCRETAPSDTDVLLATVENGVICDGRHYSKSRINGYGSNKITEIIYTSTQVKNFQKLDESVSDSDRIFPLSSDTTYNYLILSMDTSSNGDHTLVIQIGETLSFVGAESGDTQHKITPYDSILLDNENHRILYSPYNNSRFFTLYALYV